MPQIFIRCDTASSVKNALAIAAEKNELRHALRIRGGEKRAHWRALGKSQEHGALRSDVVHDGADVVDTLLKRRGSGYSVRQALASLVEGHDAGKRRETAQKPGISGELVQKLDMRDDPGHQDDVDRSAAHHLKGDVYVAAQRVTRIGQFKVAHGSALLRKRAELRSGSEVESAKNTDLCRSRLGRSRREAMPNGTPNRSDCALRFSRQSLGNGRLGLKPVVSPRCDTGTKCRTLTTSGQSVTVLAADIETLDSFRPVERAYARAFWHPIASDRPVSVGPPNGGALAASITRAGIW